MWNKLTGRSSDAPSPERKRKSESRETRRAESTVSSSSSRHPSRRDSGRGVYPPSSRNSYPNVPPSVASSYATAPDATRYSEPSSYNDRGSRSRGGDSTYAVSERGFERRRPRSSSRERKGERRHRSRSRSADRESITSSKRDRKKSSKRSKSGRMSSYSEDDYSRSRGSTRAPEAVSMSSSGTFSAQVGAPGFSQFPGQSGAPISAPTSGPPTSGPNFPASGYASMSAHVTDQFPGQDPAQFSKPYRPPSSVAEGGAGLAADYYGDQGQSVLSQPGVRPASPKINAQPHLQAASSVFSPPEETGQGSAAEFFGTAVGGAAAGAAIGAATSSSGRPPKPPKPGSSSAEFYGSAQGGYQSSSSASERPSKPPRPGSAQYSSPGKPSKPGKMSTAAALAGGAALGYAAGHHSSSHQESSQSVTYVSAQQEQSNGSSTFYGVSGGAPISQGDSYSVGVNASGASIGGPPASVHSSNFEYGPPPDKPPRPGKHSSSHSHSNAGLYAAGAAGLAGAAYAAGHHGSHSHSHSHSVSGGYANGSSYGGGAYMSGAMQGGMGGGMSTGMMVRDQRRGPVRKLVDWWKDYEDVARMEEYTEYIGVCRGCFDPRSRPEDAPRKHQYSNKRRRSGESVRATGRVDKDSRYYSSDHENRRKSKSGWAAAALGTGIAGYGAAKIGKALIGRDSDDDKYSIKSGKYRASETSLVSGRGGSRSPDRRSRTSYGVVRTDSRSPDSKRYTAAGLAGTSALASGRRSPDRKSQASYGAIRTRSRSPSRKSYVAGGTVHRRSPSPHDRRSSRITKTTYDYDVSGSRDRSRSRDREYRMSGALSGGMGGSYSREDSKQFSMRESSEFGGSAFRSRSRSRDRGSNTFTNAAIGTAVGAAALGAGYAAMRRSSRKSRSRSASPGRPGHRRRRSSEYGTHAGAMSSASLASRKSHKSSRSSLRTDTSGSLVDIGRTSRPQKSGVFGGFFSTTDKKKKVHTKKKKKKKGFFNFGNGSSSSSNSDLAFGAGYVRKGRSSRKASTEKLRTRRTSDEKLNAAVVGFGATAAALAAAHHGKNRRHSSKAEVVALRHDRREEEKHRKRRPSSPSSDEEEGWESASDADDDSSSVNSGLAFGDYAWKKSTESLVSNDSGTSKWGWRWGSKKKRTGSQTSLRLSHEELPGMPGSFPGGAAAGAPVASNIEEKMSSTSSLPTMQSMVPVQTPDPRTFDAARRSASSSSTQVNTAYMVSRPEPVPIQAPQPIAPVTSAVYQPPAQYTVPSGPPIFAQAPPPNPPRSAAAIQRSSTSTIQTNQQFSASGSYQAGSRDSAAMTAVTAREHRRRSSSPTLSSMKKDVALTGAAIATGAVVGSAISSVSKERRTSSPGNVRFGFTREQAEKHIQEERDEKRREEEKRAERRRKEADERRRKEEDERKHIEWQKGEREAAERRERMRVEKIEAERRVRDLRDREEAERRARAEETARREQERLARVEAERQQEQRAREEAERQRREREEAERRAEAARREAQHKAYLDRETERVQREAEAQSREAEARQIAAREEADRLAREHMAATSRRQQIEREIHEADTRDRREAEAFRKTTQTPDYELDVDKRQRELERREKDVVEPDTWKDAAVGVAAGVATSTVAANLVKNRNDDRKDVQAHRVVVPSTVKPKVVKPGPVIDFSLDEDEILDPDYFEKRKSGKESDKKAEIARIAANKVVADLEQKYTIETVSPAEFFAPPELLDHSDDGKKKEIDVNAGADVHVYHVPHIGVIEPPKAPPYPAAYSFSTSVDGKDPSRLSWPVPVLNLIEPTPPPSRAGSIYGGDRSYPASPDITPQETPVEESEKAKKANRVSWGQNDTHHYEVQTPESTRDQYVSEKDLRQEAQRRAATDKIVVEEDSPKSGKKKIRTYKPEPKREDSIEEIESIIAASRHGKGEQVYESQSPEAEQVTIEPDSGYSSRFGGFYETPYAETVSDLGLDRRANEGQHGFVEELDDNESPETPDDRYMPGGFVEDEEPERELSKKERRKREKAAKKAEAEAETVAQAIAEKDLAPEPSPIQTPVVPIEDVAEESDKTRSKKQRKKDKKRAEAAAAAAGIATAAAAATATHEPAPVFPAEVDEFTNSTKDKKKKAKRESIERDIRDIEPTYDSPIGPEYRPHPTEEVDAAFDPRETLRKSRNVQSDTGVPTTRTTSGGWSTIASAVTGAWGSEKPKPPSRSADREVAAVEAVEAMREQHMPGEFESSPPSVIETASRDYFDEGKKTVAIPSTAFDDLEELADAKKPKSKNRSDRYRSSGPGSPLRKELTWDDVSGAAAKPKHTRSTSDTGITVDTTVRNNGYATSEPGRAKASKRYSTSDITSAAPEQFPDYIETPGRTHFESPAREYAHDDIDFNEDRKNKSRLSESPNRRYAHDDIEYDEVEHKKSKKSKRRDKYDDMADAALTAGAAATVTGVVASESRKSHSREHSRERYASPSRDDDTRSLVSEDRYDEEGRRKHRKKKSRRDSDARSTTASEPAEYYEKERKHKHRSKDRDYDERGSTVSSPARYDDKKTTPKKEESRGIFGALFGRKSTEALPEEAKSSRSKPTDSSSRSRDHREDDYDDKERRRKKKHRSERSEAGSTYGDYDDDDLRSEYSTRSSKYTSSKRERRHRSSRDEDEKVV